MVRYLLMLCSLLFAAPVMASTVRTVAEGIPTTKYTAFIDTGTARTNFNGYYTGGVSPVGVYSASNVVVGNCVFYSTGSASCPTTRSSTVQASTGTLDHLGLGSLSVTATTGYVTVASSSNLNGLFANSVSLTGTNNYLRMREGSDGAGYMTIGFGNDSGGAGAYFNNGYSIIAREGIKVGLNTGAASATTSSTPLFWCSDAGERCGLMLENPVGTGRSWILSPSDNGRFNFQDAGTPGSPATAYGVVAYLEPTGGFTSKYRLTSNYGIVGSTATFGTPLSFSTFSVNGSLTLSTSAVLTSYSSVTASAFYGDGSNLTGISGASPNLLYYVSSGSVTSSTYSVNSGGIFFSTYTLPAGTLSIGEGVGVECATINGPSSAGTMTSKVVGPTGTVTGTAVLAVALRKVVTKGHYIRTSYGTTVTYESMFVQDTGTNAALGGLTGAGSAGQDLNFNLATTDAEFRCFGSNTTGSVNFLYMKVNRE